MNTIQLQFNWYLSTKALCLRQLQIVFAVISFLFTPFALADQLITVKSRPNVSQSLLLWEPHTANPETVILLIPGGSGNIGLSLKDGQAKAERPHLFLGQREVLLQKKMAVMVMNAPSDQEDLTQNIRMSSNHVADMQIAVKEIQRRFPKSRLVIMAHSRGTISAAYLAQSLGDQVSALVLLSGLYQAYLPGPNMPSSGPGLSKLDLSSLKMPMLLVHHAKDACPVSPVSDFSPITIPKILVSGIEITDKVHPCGPGSNHWFAGKENDVAQEIINWISGKSWKSSLP
ncbi:alpha/beta hydrolase [Undibacterium macrobrachii]|jgi:pimeloyl-ACP methyl ester carboxylesterase|uniref:alpha/beta hydrolase n=1 Tax=Undibacterium macrobrachii TaxID=1119058 RepID=UPI00167BA7D2|nr:alpha/beta hydrolase [Undibacterium macrobrachii]